MVAEAGFDVLATVAGIKDKIGDVSDRRKRAILNNVSERMLRNTNAVNLTGVLAAAIEEGRKRPVTDMVVNLAKSPVVAAGAALAAVVVIAVVTILTKGLALALLKPFVAPLIGMGINLFFAIRNRAKTAEQEAPEKTEFDVILTEIGDKKIQVIKVVRAITGLGLKEAKALVDGVPGAVKETVPKEEAESIKSQLEEAGGKAEIK